MVIKRTICAPFAKSTKLSSGNLGRAGRLERAQTSLNESDEWIHLGLCSFSLHGAEQRLDAILINRFLFESTEIEQVAFWQTCGLIGNIAVLGEFSPEEMSQFVLQIRVDNPAIESRNESKYRPADKVPNRLTTNDFPPEEDPDATAIS